MKRLHRCYDGRPEQLLRASPQQKYTVVIDKPDNIMDFRSASLERARQLRLRHSDQQLVVMMSGGMDSEWIAESLHVAGTPFIPLLVNYGDQNEHDLVWARRWLEARGITNSTEVYFDVASWYGSEEHRYIAKLCQSSELAFICQYRALLNFVGPEHVVLTGYDEPLIVADDTGGVRRWNLTYNERHASVLKFFATHGINDAEGGFINANVFAAYVTSPSWQALVANMVRPAIWNSELWKDRLYCRFFNMKPRPKYTGYEALLPMILTKTADWRAECEARYGHDLADEFKRPILDVWNDIGFL